MANNSRRNNNFADIEHQLMVNNSLRNPIIEAITDPEINARIDQMRVQMGTLDIDSLASIQLMFSAKIDQIRAQNTLISDSLSSTGRMFSERLPTWQESSVGKLPPDQLLRIPYALGMSVTGSVQGMVAVQPVMLERYLKVATTAYDAIRAIAMNNQTSQAIRDAVDALNLPTRNSTWNNWNDPSFYVYTNGPADGELMTKSALVYAKISEALMFNCDIRDTGAVTRGHMRMSDTAWQKEGRVGVSRLECKLFKYTMQSIAALNFKECGNVALGAWVRARGLSAGILPDAQTRSAKEYSFVIEPPSTVAKNKILKFERTCDFNLYDVCMNLVAMFGLLHLNKDRTYKSNDNRMRDICLSYISTLRTMVCEPAMNQMKTQLEVLCRTAAHPFGIAQTYAVAQILAQEGLLAPALQEKRNVTPPRIQRFRIIRVATDEWADLSAGRALNAAFEKEKRAVDSTCALIEECPPAYSDMHSFYGIENMAVIPDNSLDAVQTLMPIVVAYAESKHTHGGKKVGIARALCMNTVKRECRGVVKFYRKAWDKYLAGEDEGRLVAMAVGMIKK